MRGRQNPTIDHAGVRRPRVTSALGPSWSPDGLKIAFRTRSENGEINGQIYVMNADGSDQTNLFGASGGDLGDPPRSVSPTRWRHHDAESSPRNSSTPEAASRRGSEKQTAAGAPGRHETEVVTRKKSQGAPVTPERPDQANRDRWMSGAASRKVGLATG